jgi:hypothetical protein
VAVPVRGHSGLRGSSHLRDVVGARSIVVVGVVLPVVWVVLSRLIVPYDGTLHYFEPRDAGGERGVVLAWASSAGPLHAGDVVVAVDARGVAPLMQPLALRAH